ncbi:MAG: 16S rRNA (guanine(527)-N(7))-methyltransferase RsmG [Halioglobus sp.]|nr:16S rRNA (guanine(527)-N(7))-methyltransferase RsmG [Halioglobus sp.]
MTDTASPEAQESPASSALRRGAAALQQSLSNAQVELLLQYLALLERWNRTYNLTAVRDPAQMVSRHLLDCLAVAPYVRGQRAIDVGTGGGLPGIPLAILMPQRDFHLLDSNGKKTRFLFQVKTALRLDNIAVHQARAESFRPEAAFDTVLSRAFAALPDMVSSCRHLVTARGCFLAMKGAWPRRELEAVAALCNTTAVHPLVVPGLDEQRHLVEMTLRQLDDTDLHW